MACFLFGASRCPSYAQNPTAAPTPWRSPLQELRAAGRDPYAYTFQRTHTAAELQALHADLGEGAVAEGAQVAVAGRVMSRRFMGKLAFFKLVDASGSIQVCWFMWGWPCWFRAGLELFFKLVDAFPSGSIQACAWACASVCACLCGSVYRERRQLDQTLRSMVNGPSLFTNVQRTCPGINPTLPCSPRSAPPAPCPLLPAVHRALGGGRGRTRGLCPLQGNGGQVSARLRFSGCCFTWMSR